MIFVSLGTQPHEFKYMVDVVNRIETDDKIVVQIGETKNTINKTNVEVFKYSNDFEKYVKDCEVYITHGGVGSVMLGLKYNKKVITIARLKEYNEHIDNHQLEITTKLHNQKYLCHMKRTENINDIIKAVKCTTFKKYKSNTQNFVSNLNKILMED